MKNNRRKPEPEKAEEGAAAWLLTYSDLVTQLLAFFVLLFSMSIVDKQKFEDVSSSIRNSFIQIGSGESFYPDGGKSVVSITDQSNAADTANSEIKDEKDVAEGQSNMTVTEKQAAAQKAQKLEEFNNKLDQEIVNLNLSEYVSVLEERNFITLRLNSIILFDSGSADMRDSGKEILSKLAVMLKELDNGMIVQGHTDNRPINTVLFPTNWELSTKRATNIVLFLASKCHLEPAKLTAQGNGEYKPIAPNDSEDNMQKNRRIDIVIEK